MPLTLDTFQLSPTTTLSENNLELRIWYSNGSSNFLDVNGDTVQTGNGSNGFFVALTCTISSGIITVDSGDVFTTLDAQTATPQSIQTFGRLYNGNTPRQWVFSGWVIPDEASYPGGVITFEQLTIWNEGNQIINPPDTYWNQQEIVNYFNTLSPAPNASALVKGITKLSVAPVSASNPIAVGDNDPRVVSDTSYASLAAAVTAIGSTPTTLNITTAAFPNGGNTTVPVTLELRFIGAGTLTIATGQTVTILSGSSQWPTRKLFLNATAGLGTISFSGNVSLQSLSFEWWGALADGSTDNSATMLAALTAAGTCKGTIQLQAGTYAWLSNILWPVKDGISIIGQGRGVSTLLFNVTGGTGDTTSCGFYVAGLVGTNINGLKLANLTIKGKTAASDATAYELFTIADYVNDSIFENVEFANSRHSGLRYTSSSPGARSTVRDCYFHDIDNSSMTGIDGGAILGGYPQLKISGCTFPSTVGNNSGFHAIYVADWDDIIVTGNSFAGANADFQYNGGSAPKNLVLSSNSFHTVTINSINTVISGTVTGNVLYDSKFNLGTCSNVTVSGNTFIRSTDVSSSDFIGATSTGDNNHITGNSFIYAGGTGATNANGITLTTAGADNWTISGNYFKGLAYAILVQACQNVTITNNEIKTSANSDSIVLSTSGGASAGHVVRNNVIETGGSGRPITDSTGAVIEGNLYNSTHATSGLAKNRRFAGYATSTKTTTYTVTRADSLLLLDAAGGVFTATLFVATTLDQDTCITFKRISAANSPIVAAGAAQTIDGAATKTLGSQYASITLVYDGVSNWNIVSLIGTVT